MRRSGSISAGVLSSRSFSRATSTPSASVKVSGNASRSALSVGSIAGRVLGCVEDVMNPPYAAPLYPYSAARNAASPRSSAAVAAGTTPA
ncbi:Uncharacterised protein [Mycobacterium tuberculosis]|nr:Uncharacterised protein [Mycobacterium tuberculosis]